MKWNRNSVIVRMAISLVITVVVFAFDQYLKYIIIHGSWPHYFNDQLIIQPFYNHGIAFSITLPDALLGVAILASLVFVFWLEFFELHQNKLLAAVSFGLIAGGASGNILDRLRVGAVIDYVHVFQTSVFNFSDVAIAAGLLILVILLFRRKGKVEETFER